MSRGKRASTSRGVTIVSLILLLAVVFPATMLQPAALAKKREARPNAGLVVERAQETAKPGENADRAGNAKDKKNSHRKDNGKDRKNGHKRDRSRNQRSNRQPAAGTAAIVTSEAAWSLSLSTSNSRPLADQSFTLTATANQDVGPTPYYIQIYLGSTRYASCGYGTRCTVTLRGTVPGQQYSFQARIASSSGTSVQRYSNTVLVSIQFQAARLLNVPFLTQVGSVSSAPNSGVNNCGPASVAMAIRYFGNSISVADAAIAIRGSNSTSNGPTNFKGLATANLLARYGLKQKSVTTFDQMRAEIHQGRPVILLLNNNQYRYLPTRPYENNNNGWFTSNHIVVVTGWDSTSIYVNDPLRRGTNPANYRIPIDTFKSAASTTTQSTSTSWFATSVYR